MPLQAVEPKRLYRQIADQLAQLISSGEFPAGTRLPAEREFSHGKLGAGPYTVAAIDDSGPGVPPVALLRLFEPFFTTRGGGTGLGLSTAWEVVQDHGGTIDVRNRPGGGACRATAVRVGTTLFEDQ